MACRTRRADTKKRNGDLPEGYEQEILNPFLESAALEVTRAIQFFFTSTPYTRIDQLFLAGLVARKFPAWSRWSPAAPRFRPRW